MGATLNRCSQAWSSPARRLATCFGGSPFPRNRAGGRQGRMAMGGRCQGLFTEACCKTETTRLSRIDLRRPTSLYEYKSRYEKTLHPIRNNLLYTPRETG